MVSLVNSHTNATRVGWHLWEIDLRFPLNSTPGWSRSKEEEADEAAFRKAYPGYGYDGGLPEVLADFAHLPRDEVCFL